MPCQGHVDVDAQWSAFRADTAGLRIYSILSGNLQQFHQRFTLIAQRLLETLQRASELHLRKQAQDRRMEVIQVAQTVITRFTDDLDGSEASGSIEFGLDGRGYMIDLSDQNAARLRDALAPYVAAARRLGRGRRRTGATPSPASALTRMDHRVGQAAQGWGRPQRWPFSLRTRARSRRWASRTRGSRALALRQRR